MINRITNYELRITNKKRISISLFIILYSLFVIHGFASAWVLGEPVVPCGPSYTNSTGQTVARPECTQCELLHLVDNLMDFILIAAAPILATFFFIVAGLYIMLGGARPDMLATGKRMFTSALIGIIIVMLAWLATNTLITTLLLPSIPVSAPGLGNYNFQSADWWVLNCRQIGLSDQPPGTGGPPGPPSPGGCTATVCIGSVQHVNVSSNGATITWTTNIPATSQVEYNNTSNFGTGSVQRVPSTPSSSLVTNHSVTLNGLTTNFQYFYRVLSTGNGFPAVSSTGTFTTQPVACTATVCISGERAVVTNNSVTITWNTNIPSTTQVEYRVNPNFGSAGTTPVPNPANNSPVTSHSVTINGLNPSFLYYYRVLSSGGSPIFNATGAVQQFQTSP